MYSAFLTSGLHAHAASVYTYTHPHDDDMDHENASHSSTGDLAYFPPASTYHHTSSRAQSPPRKRRSSITSAASPMSPMKLAKSPARAAGNAWHIANVAASSPRSRSGSLVQNVASEETSMLGRIRSGSVGSRLRTRKPLTNRRPIALLFAPTPPPPSAPLPALPLCAPARPPLSRLAIQPALRPADVFFTNTKPPVSPVPSSPSSEFYHAPGVWKSFGTIDEMKEN
ncbi:hypothetical protein DFH08DRAFT_933481 [Mycena albidolilacea]|uniref:Uncharacterized protein n=1 Tax=Mycena albidolilacea TaxID=1033008 RepID=A0AAD7EWC3_9AGAR|nr:hypothetical protein DFH08DRAFT_933481 [Mycena albidolilacea]